VSRTDQTSALNAITDELARTKRSLATALADNDVLLRRLVAAQDDTIRACKVIITLQQKAQGVSDADSS
jgi:arsenate reductase-like glutaredoxin family protein